MCQRRPGACRVCHPRPVDAGAVTVSTREFDASRWNEICESSLGCDEDLEVRVMRTTSRDIRGNGRLRARTRRVAAALVALALTCLPVRAEAGCGCEKPPPKPAQVRPQVTYAGMPVTLFSSALVAGQSYDVTFRAMGGASATVRGVAAERRDLADAVVKVQLTVALPALPLGPAGITVAAVGTGAPILTIADTDLTVAPTPVALPTVYGAWSYPGQQAAVGRDGVVYLSLDLTGLTAPLVFEAAFNGYPLRFTERDVLFTNTQGFLMQLLVQPGDPSTAEPIPGMFVYPSALPSLTSDTLHYSRHEFNTYYLQHLERLPHATDPADADWHLDGTRHIDHDHLIIGIMGRQNDGTLPAPGATPTFNLSVRAYSLFYLGLVGTGGISTSTDVRIDSFVPATTSGGTAIASGDKLIASPDTVSAESGQPLWDTYTSGTRSYDAGGITYGSNGDVFTNGTLSLGGGSILHGDVTAKQITLASRATITGLRNILANLMSFMWVSVPAGLPDLGAVRVSNAQTIVGPGSFKVSGLTLSKGATLSIDNSAGPVTLYVTGGITTSAGARILTTDKNPEKFAIYVASADKVALGTSSAFYGVVYAPNSSVVLSGGGEFFGAFVGGSVSLGSKSKVHYDSTLRRQ